MLRNLKIGARLSLGFGLMIVLLFILGAYGVRQVRVLSVSIREMHDNAFAVSNAARDAALHITRMNRGMDDTVLARNVSDAEEAFGRVQEDEKAVDENLGILKSRISGDRSLIDSVSAQFENWRTVHDQVHALVRAGRKEEAAGLIKSESVSHILSLEKDIDALVASSNRQAESYENQAARVARGALTGTVVLMILVMAAGLGLAYGTTRSITAPLLEGVSVLVSSASEIAATATQLASSATEMASSVSETTSTVEEVKQTAKVASDKAREVLERSQQTVQVSQSGEQAVESTLGGIQHIKEQMTFIADSVVRLSEQSQTIGEIIESVDDLAEQSNLLAVNAAIEAAKAGDQGKGFAVVAREVKNLAEQSRQATSQVRGILNDIQKATSSAVMATEQGCKSVDSGIAQSTDVSDALQVLAQGIEESAQMASQIAASSQQQYMGIDQVTMAMESIKEATGQNVSGARQLEEASHNLDTLGQRLQQLVAHYSV